MSKFKSYSAFFLISEFVVASNGDFEPKPGPLVLTLISFARLLLNLTSCFFT